MENNDLFNALENFIDASDDSSTSYDDYQDPFEDENDDNQDDSTQDDGFDDPNEDESQDESQDEDEDDEEEDSNEGDEGDENDDTEDNSKVSEVALKLFNQLKDEGALNLPENFQFQGTVESFNDALTHTLESLQKSAQQSLMESIPEEYALAIKYALTEGGDLEAFMHSYYKTNDIESLDLENLEDQRQIVRQYYKATSNYDDSKIERLIKRLEAGGSLEEEAKDTYTELLEILEERRANLDKQYKNSVKDREDSERKIREELSDIISSSEFIPEARKSKVKNLLINKIRTDDNRITTLFNQKLQQIGANKSHLVQLADFVAEYDAKTGFNLDRAIKQAGTSSTKKVRAKLEEILNPSNSMDRSNPSVKKKQFDWGAFVQAS